MWISLAAWFVVTVVLTFVVPRVRGLPTPVRSRPREHRGWSVPSRGLCANFHKRPEGRHDHLTRTAADMTTETPRSTATSGASRARRSRSGGPRSPALARRPRRLPSPTAPRGVRRPGRRAGWWSRSSSSARVRVNVVAGPGAGRLAAGRAADLHPPGPGARARLRWPWTAPTLLDDALDRRWLAAAVIAGTAGLDGRPDRPHRAAAAPGLRPARRRRGRPAGPERGGEPVNATTPTAIVRGAMAQQIHGLAPEPEQSRGDPWHAFGYLVSGVVSTACRLGAGPLAGDELPGGRSGSCSVPASAST